MVGGGGGRPSGKNRHMGEVGSVSSLLRGPGMTEKDLQTIICPPDADRKSRQVGNPSMPTVQPWRYDVSIGANLGNAMTVRANFFKVNTSTVPRAIYQYDIQVFPFDLKTQG